MESNYTMVWRRTKSKKTYFQGENAIDMFFLHKFYWNEWIFNIICILCAEWRAVMYIYMWYLDSSWSLRIMSHNLWKYERIISTTVFKNVKNTPEKSNNFNISLIMSISQLNCPETREIYVHSITPIFHYEILFIPNSEHFWWVSLASDAVTRRIWVLLNIRQLLEMPQSPTIKHTTNI